MKQLKKKSRIISYLEFKLNKELAYENTYGKEEEIQKEYEKYLEEKAKKFLMDIIFMMEK